MFTLKYIIFNLSLVFLTFSVCPPALPSGSPGPSLSPWTASDPLPVSVWFFPDPSAPFSPAPRNFLPAGKRGGDFRTLRIFVLLVLRKY